MKRLVRARFRAKETMMGREVRRVPRGWEHPKQDNGDFIPLFDGSNFTKEQQEWDEVAAKWAEGLRDDWNGGWKPLEEDDEKSMTFEEWYGGRPDAEDYMPEWTEEDRTQLMMYENTTEGTPISPAFETPEELARWLADNGASAFGSSTASYDAWLRVAKGGYEPSAVYTPEHGLQSGMEAL